MPRVLEAITPLGPKALIFHEMAGEESLSTMFDFNVTLVSEQLGIAPKALLGKPITVSVETENSGPKRYLNGICTRFAMIGRHKQYHIYTAQLKPWLWLASRRSDSKIFQQKKVPDIIQAVLGKYGFPIKLKLSASYRVWDYCVQYHETDYQFVARLMEHEGIYYHFEHKAGQHTLVLCDGIGSHQALAPRSAVNYFGIDAATDAREEHFHTWRPREEIDPGEYLSDDYDFTKPKSELATNNKAPKGHANDAWERYSWPGRLPRGWRGRGLRQDPQRSPAIGTNSRERRGQPSVSRPRLPDDTCPLPARRAKHRTLNCRHHLRTQEQRPRHGRGGH